MNPSFERHSSILAHPPIGNPRPSNAAFPSRWALYFAVLKPKRLG